MFHILRVGVTRPSVTLFISESILAYFCVIFSTFLRYSIVNAPIIFADDTYINASIIVVAINLSLYYLDAYSTYFCAQKTKAITYWSIIQAIALSYIFLSIFYYAFPSFYVGRGILSINFIVLSCVLLIWRTIFPVITSEVGLVRRSAILGDDELATHLHDQMENKRHTGFRICLRISLRDRTVEQIVKILEKRQIDTIIITKDTLKKLPLELLWELHLRGDQLLDGLSFYEWLTGRIHPEALQLTNLFFVYNPANLFFTGIIKRMSDILLALFILLITLPFHLIVALLIKLASPGPIFYSQTRTGLNEKTFKMYKYRTMILDAEKYTGPKQASDNDPRITWIGRYLRRTRFDELPQLLNVIRGEMSIIGPRPERPHFTDIFKGKIPYYFFRHSVRPGLTGWAQVNHEYTNDFHGAYEKFQYDMYYIKKFSLGLDFIIMLKTIKVIITGKGAK